LGRPDYPCGKSRFGHPTALRAAINLRLMLGDFQPRLRQIEHLPRLNIGDHFRREPRPAMGATAGRVLHGNIGLRHLPQRAALMPRLTAGFLAGLAPQTAKNPRLLGQTVTRRRLAAVRTVFAQLTPKSSVLLLKRRDLMQQLVNQHTDFGRDLHPYVDSHSSPRRKNFYRSRFIKAAWELPKKKTSLPWLLSCGAVI